MYDRQTTGSMDGYRALTEKQKQTLRLLLEGHDAKSMARLLGLSVHTINERLRDARQKLSVSSSKEAARLLRHIEGAAPENIGAKTLGDADPVPADHLVTQPRTKARLSRRSIWVVGGIVMIMFIAALLAQPLLLQPQATKISAQPVAVEDSATKSARAWLELVDASKWQESWAATTASFRSHNTVAVWQSASEKVRAPLGPMVSRAFVSSEDVPGYQVIRFRTNYANRRGAIETLSLAYEDDAWKVAGIYVE
jgi:DNA-binding CsgD family transcriptional regulator